MTKKKTQGALIVESDDASEPQTGGFQLSQAKLYDSSQWAGKCLSCGNVIGIGQPFAWYATGITTCKPCYDDGNPPQADLVAEKIAKQASKPKIKGKYVPKVKAMTGHASAGQGGLQSVAKAVNAVATGGGSDAFSVLTDAVGALTECSCGECEQCESKLLAKPIETQKVRGCRILKEFGLPVPTYYVLPGAEAKAQQYVAGLAAVGKAAFARPCQAKQTDEHGWIESRAVAQWSDVLTVLEEVHAADENAQVMIMPQLDGNTSAIVTTSMFSVGAGHEAATAGKGAINIPVAVNFPVKWLEKAGVKTSPYLEIVDGYAVQLRDGPVPPSKPDWIPADMTCHNVVMVTSETHPDLTAFNKLAAETFPKISGLIVHMPNGSPTSHYAAHCKLNGIPFVTTFEPQVNTSYAATAEAFDPEKYRTAFLDGAASDLRALGTDRAAIAGALAASILVTHQSTEMLATEDGARLVGAGVASLFYATMAACHGETRHCKKLSLKKHLAREQIYEGAWSNPLDARRTLPNALALFADKSLWSHAYGGPKWAAATEAALTLWDTIVDAGRNGGELATILKAAHTLLNMAHNTGWLLNKFLSKEHFDACAAARPEPFVSVTDSHGNVHATSAILYRLLTNPARLPLDWSKMRQGRWKHSKTRLVKAKTAKAVAKHGGAVPALKAQSNLKNGHAHIQYQWAGQTGYATLDVALTPSQATALARALAPGKPTVNSMAGSATPYVVLTCEPIPGTLDVAILLGADKIATITYLAN